MNSYDGNASWRRMIACVAIDDFGLAVEVMDSPSLAGRPIVLLQSASQPLDGSGQPVGEPTIDVLRRTFYDGPFAGSVRGLVWDDASGDFPYSFLEPVTADIRFRSHNMGH